MADNQQIQDTKILGNFGTATPFVSIFNGEGNPIIDSKSGLPIGMLTTDFEYIYDETKDDSATIQMETDNPDLVSSTELAHKMPLRLQWGWIFPDGSRNIGPVRRVMIKDHEIEFTPEGTKITLKCVCASSLLKDKPATYFQENNNFEGYVNNLLKGNIAIKFSTYEAKPIVHRSVVMKVNNAENNQRSR